MTINGEVVELDNEGYLLEPKDWNLAIAGKLAEGLGIDMSQDHWFVVDYVRAHFEQTGCVPEARHTLKAMRRELGSEKATRKYLYRLFPWGYGQMACKIAGMRKPLKLLLDL